MRPQQQNRRMRGRNNNRKGPNPLTRSYESNGPDVKIRGSAQQVADKYTALARDAQSAGDRVMAENYLQHAEHYNRIIAAAQSQSAQNNAPRDQRDDFDEDDADERQGNQNNAPAQTTSDSQPKAAQDGQQDERPQTPRGGAKDDGSGPQPVIEGTPVEVAIEQETIKTAAEKPKRSRRANGSPPAEEDGKDGKDGEAAAPRRARRPRRPRASDAETAEAAAPAPASAEGESQTSSEDGQGDLPLPAAAQ
ncbi:MULTISPECIES: DUF4167 domain-containing protein [Nitratireductor]|uniref:DUF4167 domain-containing protein n=1 Tax=Nitratireductor TaxID=245876 RepID=UPI000D0DA5A2|nr:MULTISPECIES: DUF4167 domain-containing protein [Nitratireductor]PSM16037.1 DUF4167 domain-containing protein [Nitratireductor sp. StC3]